MKNIRDMHIIEIDVTNLCNKSCCNCTRFCGHYVKDKIFFMNLKYIEDILITLKDYKRCVGAIGGEPTLHPDILKISELYKKYRNNDSVLFSNTKDSIKYKNFYGRISINDHTDINCKHSPLLVSSESIKEKYNISSEDVNFCIDKCWIQNQWSATVNLKGAYFCEVAGMLSYLLDGPDGLDIYEHPNWWKYDLDKYQYQIDWACEQCGGGMLLKEKTSNIEIDDISLDMLDKLIKIKSPKIIDNKYKLYDEGFFYEEYTH